MPVQTAPPKIEVPRANREGVVAAPQTERTAKVVVRDLNFFYGKVQALHNI